MITWYLYLIKYNLWDLCDMVSIQNRLFLRSHRNMWEIFTCWLTQDSPQCGRRFLLASCICHGVQEKQHQWEVQIWLSQGIGLCNYGCWQVPNLLSQCPGLRLKARSCCRTRRFWCCSSKVVKQERAFFLTQRKASLFYCFGLQLIGWGPPTLWRTITLLSLPT